MQNINKLIKVDAELRDLPDDATEWPAVKVVRPGQPPLYFASGETKRMSQTKAIAYAKKLTLCGVSDWRLPELPELETIRELDRYEPAGNKDFFPACNSGGYWTQTDVPWSSVYARCVYFSFGSSSWGLRSLEFFVRAVRVGQ